MNTNFDTNTPLSDNVLDSQKEDVAKTIEVLENSKEDLKADWTRECFDVVIEAMKEKRAMH